MFPAGEKNAGSALLVTVGSQDQNPPVMRSMNFLVALFLIPWDITIHAASAADTTSVQFKSSEMTITRDRTDPRSLAVGIDIVLPKSDSAYHISVEQDLRSSSLSNSEYELHHAVVTIQGNGNVQEHRCFVTIQPDSLPDRDRTLILTLKVTMGSKKTLAPNKGKHQKLTLTVKATAPELEEYNYLAYIGTNFDLVDGLQSKNLFFASNIFIPWTGPDRRGLFVSLYGNRAFSSSDSLLGVSWRNRVERTSDTTYTGYWSTADRKTTLTSDNLGAYFSPFFSLRGLSKEENQVQYFFAPSLEFVWRRLARTTSYTNILPADTIDYVGFVQNTYDVPDRLSTRESRFEFRIGPGFFIRHDTPRISVRLYASIGYSTQFLPSITVASPYDERKYERQHDCFFTGRLWITEPSTGITLQAEVVNMLIDPRPYYVVTLSKAVSFKNIGRFFSPITSR